MTDRRRAVLAAIAEESDPPAAMAAARTQRLDGDRVQIPLRLPAWLAADLRTYSERSGLSINQIVTFLVWQLFHADITRQGR